VSWWSTANLSSSRVESCGVVTSFLGFISFGHFQLSKCACNLIANTQVRPTAPHVKVCGSIHGEIVQRRSALRVETLRNIRRRSGMRTRESPLRGGDGALLVFLEGVPDKALQDLTASGNADKAGNASHALVRACRTISPLSVPYKSRFT
jgi:hypothetical protein